MFCLPLTSNFSWDSFLLLLQNTNIDERESVCVCVFVYVHDMKEKPIDIKDSKGDHFSQVHQNLQLSIIPKKPSISCIH